MLVPGLDLQWLIRASLFLPAVVVTCIYAWRRGGGPERATALLVIGATAATVILPQASFRHVVIELLLIDLLLLGGLICVALIADRFWPMYFAAVHLLSVAAHGVRAYDPLILPDVYARVGGELAYLTLAILAVGTWRHGRRGDDCDWSWQVRNSR